MKLLEKTEKFVVTSEVAAKDLIEEFRASSFSKGFTVKKAGYEYKTKKAKGEIVAEAWVVTIVQTYATLWEDLNE